jgi:hypothetical protein
LLKWPSSAAQRLLTVVDGARNHVDGNKQSSILATDAVSSDRHVADRSA